MIIFFSKFFLGEIFFGEPRNIERKSIISLPGKIVGEEFFVSFQILRQKLVNYGIKILKTDKTKFFFTHWEMKRLQKKVGKGPVD